MQCAWLVTWISRTNPNLAEANSSFGTAGVRDGASAARTVEAMVRFRTVLLVENVWRPIPSPRIRRPAYMSKFLDNMGFLARSQRSFLEQIGAETPVTLMATLWANPEVYEHFLGRSHLERLLVELDRLMTPEERHRLKD